MGKKSQEYIDYLKSPEWQEKKEQVFRERGRCCENCGNTERLFVHHITFKRLYNENTEDLCVLCYTCNKQMWADIKKADYIAERKKNKEQALIDKNLIKVNGVWVDAKPPTI
jgi:5-methylcytosine-specific restriction endonuclease McrA